MTLMTSDNKSKLDRKAYQVACGYRQIVAWPTVLLGCVVFTSYWAIPILVVLHDLSLLVAIPLMAILTYAAYTVLHEAVHYCINGNIKSLRWLNNSMGYLAATMLLVPLTAHRYQHLVHHQSTNDDVDDPDLYSKDIFVSLKSLLYAVYMAVAGQYQAYIAERWTTAPKAKNRLFVVEILFALLLRALPFVIVVVIGGSETQEKIFDLLLLFVGGGFLGTFLLVFLFAYIVHRPHQTSERYLNTSTIIIQGPLSWPLTLLWGYQNYHAVHHLFPWVPFYHYQRLFKQIKPTMEAMDAPIYRLTWRGLQTISAT